ncbi:MAG: alcohol dehydrogenase catalytic domain-containing protein [Candidatus Rokubacteria bacterium]|nr:alcohol dehydrogenase catalytic domain-containing protein [Candidatus Rokubacteria bacterium]
MKAIAFRGVGDVRTETVPDPTIVDPTDVVLRITTSAVCGSDLHQYHGRGGALVQPGSVMGHEFMGVVDEVGAGVTTLTRGDRVIVPFSVSCGRCEWCRRRLPTQCATTQRAVFGGRWGHVFPGGQAERIRVPFADHLCEKVPAGMSDEDALFLGDILSTGFVCAENGGIRPGDTVAVFGAGPVGLLAMQSAQLFGPARVFAVDRVDYRLALAGEFGAEPVHLDRGDPAEQLRAATGGHGPDVVLECVGHETPFTQAIQAVRAAGTVSSVGVYVETSMGFPAREAFFKDLNLKMGICNARNYMAPLMPLVQGGKLRPARIITHTMPLGDAPKGYAIFDKKEDRAVKVMLKP